MNNQVSILALLKRAYLLVAADPEIRQGVGQLMASLNAAAPQAPAQTDPAGGKTMGPSTPNVPPSVNLPNVPKADPAQPAPNIPNIPGAAPAQGPGVKLGPSAPMPKQPGFDEAVVQIHNQFPGGLKQAGHLVETAPDYYQKMAEIKTLIIQHLEKATPGSVFSFNGGVVKFEDDADIFAGEVEAQILQFLQA